MPRMEHVMDPAPPGRHRGRLRRRRAGPVRRHRGRLRQRRGGPVRRRVPSVARDRERLRRGSRHQGRFRLRFRSVPEAHRVRILGSYVHGEGRDRDADREKQGEETFAPRSCLWFVGFPIDPFLGLLLVVICQAHD
mmetsp:Transcript_8333/g.27334  ORF Transcript_8333/g.27334 Transcript_8333/m.27334 type:complete len:136 (-) Transcript_8333:50-457(-)